MERTRDEGVKVWFWRRDDPGVPDAVAQKGLSNLVFGDTPTIRPDPTWGPPGAYFPVGDFCDYDSHFNAHMMVFDLTFCVSDYMAAIMSIEVLMLQATG